MPQSDPSLPVTSSTEPTWALEARECYRDVVKALLQAQIPCAVGGAFALHKHTGIWRTTKDLDLVLEASDVPAALRALQSAGFVTAIHDPIWLAKASRGDYFVDLITGMGNASIRVDHLWIERSTPDEILGFPCRVLAAEEMIASKVFVTRRERFDGPDVAHLFRASAGHLDWSRLLQLLDEHWELLYWSLVLFAYVYPAQTDLVPNRIWHELTQRFAGQATHPDKSAPFRGSLVDPLMFAIDVDEWGERNLYRELCDQHPSPLSEDVAAVVAEPGLPRAGSQA